MGHDNVLRICWLVYELPLFWAPFMLVDTVYVYLRIHVYEILLEHLMSYINLICNYASQ
jgi:hypothetical protein